MEKALGERAKPFWAGKDPGATKARAIRIWAFCAARPQMMLPWYTSARGRLPQRHRGVPGRTGVLAGDHRLAGQAGKARFTC